MNLSNKYSVNRIVKSVILYIMAFLCISCTTFRRNPNLRLLLKEEKYSLLNPRWTKSGWVYYIRCDFEACGEYGPGEVWRIKDDGEANELVLPGTCTIMDISPSETLLIAFRSQDHDLPLILYNIKTMEVKTLLNAYYPNCAGLQFGSSDNFVYYSDNNGLHRVNIFSKNDTVIVSGMIYYFDIYHDSLIYYAQDPPYMHRIVDISTGKVVYEASNLRKGFFINRDSLLLVAERRDGLQLYDIKTSEKSKLDAAIEEITVWAERGNCIDFDPTGEQIVFGATGDVSESGNAGPFELWILEKF